MELGREDGGVALHQLQGVRLILQIADVAQLIDLVKADGLDVDELGEVGDVVLAGGHDGHARAGERDLAGGGEFIHHVPVATVGAKLQNVGELHEIAVKLMDAVRIIPHEHEVRRGGLHGGQTADGPVGVDHALGIGVLGDVPHALDGGVLHQLLHHAHIRAGGGHRNGDHLHAEGLRDLEVAVVAGNGADPLDLVQLGPGLLAVEQTVGKCLGHGVKHELEAGVAAHENLRGLAAQQLREQRTGGGDAGHLAVVPRLHAVDDVILGSFEYVENVRDHVQLLASRLAPGHVQIQPQRLLPLIGGPNGIVFRLTLRRGHFSILHINSSSQVISDWSSFYADCTKKSIIFVQNREKIAPYTGAGQLCSLFVCWFSFAERDILWPCKTRQSRARRNTAQRSVLK